MTFDALGEGLLNLILRPLAPDRSLVPFTPTPLPAIVDDAADGDGDEIDSMPELLAPFDASHMSPREMAERSQELYAVGLLSWDEYSLLAFQPELHPAYNKTIGALLGEKAEPDRRRNYVAEWWDRLAFERRYNREEPGLVEQTARIAEILDLLSRAAHRAAERRHQEENESENKKPRRVLRATRDQ